MPDLILPIIHPNGDRPETLTDALRAASIALGTAIEALHETAPNSRNYYPQPGLFEKARAQYDARLQVLIQVRHSVIQEYDGIEEQRRRGAPRSRGEEDA